MGKRTCRAGMGFLALTLLIGLAVRAEEVTIVGSAISVTGLVLHMADSGNVPVVNEPEGTEAGEFSRATINLLIGLGAVLLILIIVFVVLLLKPKKNSPLEAKPDTVVKPGPRTGTAMGNGAMPTIAIPVPAPAADETQFLKNPLAELRVERGIDQDAVFVVNKNTSAIGRAGARINDVVLTDNTVSKAQATLLFAPASGRYSIMNEGTKNPTKVNGEIIGQETPLAGGELIEMGLTALRFTIL